MKHYELLCILPGTLAETETAPIIQEIQTMVQGSGGQELTIQDMGKSRLAYPVKQIRYGYFELFFFTLDEGSAAELTEKLRLSPSVIRFVFRAYSPARRQTKEEIISRMKQRAESGVDRAQDHAPIIEKPLSTPEPGQTEKIAEPKKVDMEEIDKKLNEILDTTLNAV